MRAVFAAGDRGARRHGQRAPGGAPGQRGPARAAQCRRRAQRQAADAAIECIGCGVCYSACDVVAWDKDYLGPAALNRAWTLINDVRDRGIDARLDAISGSQGCQACHTHMSCTSFCPKAIAPTYSIAGLKRAVLRRSLRGAL